MYRLRSRYRLGDNGLFIAVAAHRLLRSCIILLRCIIIRCCVCILCLLRSRYSELCKEIVLFRSGSSGSRCCIIARLVYCELCEEIIFGSRCVCRCRSRCLCFLIRSIYCKLCKAFVHRNACARNGLSVLIKELIVKLLFLGFFGSSLGSTFFLCCFSLLLKSLLSRFLFLSLSIGISCDPCGSISQRNDSGVVHAELFTLFLFFKKKSHFLFVSFYKLFSQIGFTFLTGYLLQIRHLRSSVETSYIFRLKKVDTTACFLFVFGSVNQLVKRRCYQCYIHIPLSQPQQTPHIPLLRQRNADFPHRRRASLNDLTSPPCEASAARTTIQVYYT